MHIETSCMSLGGGCAYCISKGQRALCFDRARESEKDAGNHQELRQTVKSQSETNERHDELKASAVLMWT